MTWFKVDDTLAFHPKVLAAGNVAMGLWVRAGSWSAQQLTDGFVPDSVVATLDGKTAAKQLEAAGLWRRVDGGWQFHGWDERQPTREQVESHRDRERRKKARQRAHGAASVDRDDDTGRFVSPRDNQGDAPGDSRGVSPATRPDPTRPTSVSRQSTTDVRVGACDDEQTAADIDAFCAGLADADLWFAIARARAVRLGRINPNPGWLRAVAHALDHDRVSELAGLGLDPAAIDRRLDGIDPEPERPKLREINGRICQHISGTGFVPVSEPTPKAASA